MFERLRKQLSRTPIPTGPVPFGRKIGWIAIRSEDSRGIISSLPIRSPKPENWQEGIEAAYEGDHIFVTPPVNGWICVVGQGVMGAGDRLSVQSVAQKAGELSSVFGQAHSYASHRVIEYHHWMQATNGVLLRSFAYLGETGELLANEGPLTEKERSLTLFNLPPENWTPDEEDVMMVASHWSFDPSRLSAESGPAESGVIAKMRS
jgi:hypothetical protein